MTAPDVEILPEARRRICELAAQSEDGRETGGILLGRGPDDHGVITVEHAGEPGPEAQRQTDFFLRDLAHAKRLAEAAWQNDEAVWIGEWHTHPTGLKAPSPRDLVTYAGLLVDPELSFTAFVSVLVVPDPDWASTRLLTWILGTTAPGERHREAE